MPLRNNANEASTTLTTVNSIIYSYYIDLFKTFSTKSPSENKYLIAS